MALKKKQAGGLGSLLGGLLGTLIPIPGVGTAVGSAVGGALGGAAGGALGEEERGAGPEVPRVNFDDAANSQFLQNLTSLAAAAPGSLANAPLGNQEELFETPPFQGPKGPLNGSTQVPQNLPEISKAIGQQMQVQQAPAPTPAPAKRQVNDPRDAILDQVDAAFAKQDSAPKLLSLKDHGASNNLSTASKKQVMGSGLLAGAGPKSVQDVLQGNAPSAASAGAGLSGGDIASLAASGLGSLAQALAKGSTKRPSVQSQQPTFQQNTTLMELLQGLPVAAPTQLGGL